MFGEAQNDSAAYKYFKLGCSAGDVVACGGVADLEYLGRVPSTDGAATFAALDRACQFMKDGGTRFRVAALPAAVAGRACLDLGDAYEKGAGKPRDRDRALAYYDAASDGLPSAYLELGRLEEQTDIGSAMISYSEGCREKCSECCERHAALRRAHQDVAREVDASDARARRELRARREAEEAREERRIERDQAIRAQLDQAREESAQRQAQILNNLARQAASASSGATSGTPTGGGSASASASACKADEAMCSAKRSNLESYRRYIADLCSPPASGAQADMCNRTRAAISENELYITTRCCGAARSGGAAAFAQAGEALNRGAQALAEAQQRKEREHRDEPHVHRDADPERAANPSRDRDSSPGERAGSSFDSGGSSPPAPPPPGRAPAEKDCSRIWFFETTTQKEGGVAATLPAEKIKVLYQFERPREVVSGNGPSAGCSVWGLHRIRLHVENASESDKIVRFSWTWSASTVLYAPRAVPAMDVSCVVSRRSTKQCAFHEPSNVQLRSSTVNLLVSNLRTN